MSFKDMDLEALEKFAEQMSFTVESIRVFLKQIAHTERSVAYEIDGMLLDMGLREPRTRPPANEI